MRSHVKKGFLKSIQKGLGAFKDDSLPLGVLVLREDDKVTFLTVSEIGEGLGNHPEVLETVIDLFQSIRADYKDIRITEIDTVAGTDTVIKE